MYHTREIKEMHSKVFCNLKVGDNLVDLGLDGRIILK
jgi:hypothetical protein